MAGERHRYGAPEWVRNVQGTVGRIQGTVGRIHGDMVEAGTEELAGVRTNFKRTWKRHTQKWMRSVAKVCVPGLAAGCLAVHVVKQCIQGALKALLPRQRHLHLAVDFVMRVCLPTAVVGPVVFVYLVPESILAVGAAYIEGISDTINVQPRLPTLSSLPFLNGGEDKLRAELD